MAGPGTQWTGPLLSGPIKDPGDLRGPVNIGLAVLRQTATLVANGTNTVTFQFNLPSGSQILDIHMDTTLAWNSGTTDSLTVGLTPGGSDFISTTSVQTVGRATPTYLTSATELSAMNVVGTTPSNGVPVFATVTPTGTAATTGITFVTIIYVQTVQLLAGDA
jgi:hypothetical protein